MIAAFDTLCRLEVLGQEVSYKDSGAVAKRAEK